MANAPENLSFQNPHQHKWPSRTTGGLAVLLVLAGLVCSPAGYSFLYGRFPAIDDYLFPASGWGLGLALIGSGTLLFALKRRIHPSSLLLLAATCVACFGTMELVLADLGIHSSFHFRWKTPKLVSWWDFSPVTGSRYIAREWSNPNWPINRNGFVGATDFTVEACADAEIRILAIGDSFTWGVQASSYANSYVALFEKRLKAERNVVVWNTAIPGIGQKQELLSLKTYAPLLRPQFVILGFFMNDFDDNMYPMSMYYIFEDSPNFIMRYEDMGDGRIRTLSPVEAYWRAHPLSERLSASRVFLQFCNVARSGQQWLAPLVRREVSREQNAVESPGDSELIRTLRGGMETADLLAQIRDYVEGQPARLIALIIPHIDDLKTPSRTYQAAVSLFDSLGIEYVELRDFLERSDYVSRPSVHWNDSGHKKAAGVLAEHVENALNKKTAGPATDLMESFIASQ